MREVKKRAQKDESHAKHKDGPQVNELNVVL
jgi:hypothetical protein